MMKKYNSDIRIGDLLKVTTYPAKSSYQDKIGVVSDILPAGVVPDKDLVKKYYSVGAPDSAFEPAKVDRIVVQYDEDNYMVLPNIKDGHFDLKILGRIRTCLGNARYKVVDVVNKVTEYQERLYDLEAALKVLRPYKDWEEDVDKDERYSVQMMYKELISGRKTLIDLMETELILNDVL